MNPDDFKSKLLQALGLPMTPAPQQPPPRSSALLAAALGQPSTPADATSVYNRPKNAPPMRSIGPVTKGNIPLPEATYQSQYRPRYDKAMSLLADALPVISEARGIAQGHQQARQGSPFAGAITAALAAVPMGGRIGRVAEEGVANAARPHLSEVLSEPAVQRYYDAAQAGQRRGIGSVGDLFGDASFLDAHPDVRNVPVIVDPTLPPNVGGRYVDHGIAERAPDTPPGVILLNPQNADAESLLHEVIHAQRSARGRAMGDAPGLTYAEQPSEISAQKGASYWAERLAEPYRARLAEMQANAAAYAARKRGTP